jgi:hypothetical protein
MVGIPDEPEAMEKWAREPFWSNSLLACIHGTQGQIHMSTLSSFFS